MYVFEFTNNKIFSRIIRVYVPLYCTYIQCLNWKKYNRGTQQKKLKLYDIRKDLNTLKFIL